MNGASRLGSRSDLAASGGEPAPPKGSSATPSQRAGAHLQGGAGPARPVAIAGATPWAVGPHAGAPPGSFSMYIDHQGAPAPLVDSTPPSEDHLQKYMHTMYPKHNEEWVNSDVVIKCQGCNSTFNFFLRKHHCRACGCVYCHNCCSHYIKIPEHLIRSPLNDRALRTKLKNLYHWVVKGEKSLVCRSCYRKIDNLLRIEPLIQIFRYLDLRSLHTISMVSKDWHHVAVYYLSKFRNIQYMSSEARFDDWEQDILWQSRHLIAGHNNWLLCLVKSVVWQYYSTLENERLADLVRLIRSPSTDEPAAEGAKKRVGCWGLMCSRRCNLELDLLDFLELFDYIGNLPNVSTLFWHDDQLRLLVNELLVRLVVPNDANRETLKSCVPYLSCALRLVMNTELENIDEQFVLRILDHLSLIKEELLVYLLWECNALDVTRDLSTHNFVTIVEDYVKRRLDPATYHLATSTVRAFTSLKSHPDPHAVRLPILYPFDVNYHITKIVTVKEYNSNSRPLRLDVVLTHRERPDDTFETKLIIKKDPGVRKEQVVASVISLLHQKLLSQAERRRIDYFDRIPTYNIITLSPGLGAIEFVHDSATLRQVNDNGFTLQNFIFKHHPQTPVGIIKERFMKSLAISSCLSYILGLGDRHMDNIMVTTSGLLYHIDYSFILEQPVNIFGSPVIRITSDMIDFLGGPQSEFYAQFKTYIIQVFDILRLYNNLITNNYRIMSADGLVSDWPGMRTKLGDRFMHGMNCKEVEITLINEIEHGSNSYSSALMDFFHSLKWRSK